MKLHRTTVEDLLFHQYGKNDKNKFEFPAGLIESQMPTVHQNTFIEYVIISIKNDYMNPERRVSEYLS